MIGINFQEAKLVFFVKVAKSLFFQCYMFQNQPECSQNINPAANTSHNPPTVFIHHNQCIQHPSQLKSTIKSKQNRPKEHSGSSDWFPTWHGSFVYILAAILSRDGNLLATEIVSRSTNSFSATYADSRDVFRI